MSDILKKIVAYKREEVTVRRAGKSSGELEAAIREATPSRGFANALMQKKQIGSLSLIGEIKRGSPSKGLIRDPYDPADLARCYEAGGAACLSILTDGPSFFGDDSHLGVARGAVKLPCLRKDFLIDPWQVTESRAIGADAILVILAVVDDVLARDLIDAAHAYAMDAIVEVHTEGEMKRALRLQSKLIGINNRDLKTFKVDLSITEALAAASTNDRILVAESGIFTPEDVTRLSRTGVTGMLVGESLMRQADVTAATKHLLQVH